jgi:gamma-glutamylcyclotransferase (GGCT)/AIG2-like uncharacterized protein YtfP
MTTQRNGNDNDNARFLFVYGTLKCGGDNCHYLHGAEFVGECKTPPYFRLWDLDIYPALTIDALNGYTIRGELYKVNSLDRFDHLENYPYGYDRAEFTIIKYGVRATVYYQRKIEEGAPELINGSWPLPLPLFFG